MILVRGAALDRSRTLMDEELDPAGGEDRASGPLCLRCDADQALVEARGRLHVVGEEGNLDGSSHVAISNSLRTSLSEVLRSVHALRSPTISAQGSS